MSNKRPSIRQLEYFAAVARASNFRKAALKLGVSQPALTLQIAELEEGLDVQLFDRSRAGTLLTPAGRNLLPLAKEILDQFELLSDVSQSGKETELSGTFKLGIIPTIGPALLSVVIPELYKRYPDLKLHLYESLPGELEAGLGAGDYDLILTALPMQTGKQRIRPLFTERLKIVVHKDHPLAKKSTIKGRDLHQQEIISVNKQMHLQQQVQALCGRYGAHLLTGVEANSLSMLSLMLQMNVGIGILPEMFVETTLSGCHELRFFDLEDEMFARTHVAVWRTQASARNHFQKLSFEIKAIAMDSFGDVLTEVVADETLPETW